MSASAFINFHRGVTFDYDADPEHRWVKIAAVYEADGADVEVNIFCSQTNYEAKLAGQLRELADKLDPPGRNTHTHVHHESDPDSCAACMDEDFARDAAATETARLRVCVRELSDALRSLADGKPCVYPREGVDALGADALCHHGYAKPCPFGVANQLAEEAPF